MQTQIFPAGATPRLTITGCQGVLSVDFWDKGDFAVEPGLPESAIQLEGTGLVIREARGDMQLRVPAAAEIAVENHKGDLRIATIDGSVRLRDIDGNVFVSGAGTLAIEPDQLLRRREWSPRPRRDVEAREIGAAEIAEVHGSLLLVTAQRAAVGDVGGNATIRGIAGELTLGDVGGSCEIAQVGSALALGDVGGNCQLESISDGVRAGHIGGTAQIRATGPILALGNIGGNLTLTDAPLGQEAIAAPAGSIAVGGSARIELPQHADLTIDAIVGGGISGRGAGGGPGMRTIVYGGGAARLRLTVGGHLTLV
jgi:hypothetical protein